ncbi:MAG: hypothetical protein L0Y75_00145 [Acidobacteria bacterium]|nr:hypothetical protein [Acidobacteriota bacterium]
MQYQVLVQNLPDGLFSAFVVGIPDIVAEGATDDWVEKIANYRHEVDAEESQP